VKCLFTGRADFLIWVVITTFIIFRGLFDIFWGRLLLSTYYNYIMTNPQKGIWSFYNSRHDQSTMGIDPMNNISNNNKNILCSYIISTLPLNKKGILQQHQARERGQHHQQHQVGERTTSSISSWNTDWRIYKSSEVFFIGNIVILKGMQSSSPSICISIKLIHHHHRSARLARHNTGLALRHSC
jgi:hypothetical protein